MVTTSLHACVSCVLAMVSWPWPLSLAALLVVDQLGLMMIITFGPI
jgi:hypothetical protein